MTRILLLMLIVMSSIDGYSHKIFFKDIDNVIISGVHCTGFSADMDSIGHWISNDDGAVNINLANVSVLHSSHPDFKDRLIYLSQLHNDTVILSLSTILKEIVVTPNDIQDFSTHTSYRISYKDMERYSNVLQSLNVIPNLTVLQNGGIFFEGDQNIKVLIDGVEATLPDIQTLSKEDVAKVNVYETPPLRFLTQGIDAVIDIRLKSEIYGGNGALELSQAFQSLKGINSAALYYNYKQSRFSLLYSNENRHYKKFCQSEILNYDFDGQEYKKIKQGLNSKKHFDDNDIKLSYQINKPNNFLYNVKAGIALNRNGYNANQKVFVLDDAFLANNYFHSGYTRYNIGNYIEKQLKDGSSILGNMNYQHYSTDYSSRYSENGKNLEALQNSHSQYSTILDAIFSEIQYQLPKSALGYFSFSAYDTYKHSKYNNTTTSFFQETNIAGVSAQWMGWIRAFRWYLTMGVDWFKTASTVLEKANNLIIPAPMININWRPNSMIQISADYSYSGGVPSIAQLSETNQWLDTKLVYHGNSSLKPYKTHSVGIRFVYNQKIINLAIRGSFASSPNMICDMYTLKDDYMLQTLVNLDTYRLWNSQFDLTIRPLGNNTLTFWNRVILSDVEGKNSQYSWDGYRFQWMSDLSLNLKHWTVDLFYQYPGKIVEGQLERPRAQCWSATVLYRPNSNLSLGVEWFMPFGKNFKESEHTVNAAPVYADSEYTIKDRVNMLSLKLSYNFSFGRNRNRVQPQFDNFDNDSGILHK